MKVWSVLVFFIFAAITALIGIIAIWTCDERWAETAGVTGGIAALFGAIRIFGYSKFWQGW